MAESHGTQEHQTQTFRHCKSFYWEHLEGTKEEIQAAGFGVGKLFPGEPGANKRRLSLGKVNGFAHVSVSKKRSYERSNGVCTDTGLFEVYAHYIKREQPDSRTMKTDFAPGVTRHEDLWHDVYIGSPDALIKAGLVLPDQLPGTANTGKVRTTFLPDGTRVTKGGSGAWNIAGSKTVKRFGNRVAVEIYVAVATGKERHAAWSKRSEDARMQHDRALSERLGAIAIAQAAVPPKGRGHLRLVWSA